MFKNFQTLFSIINYMARSRHPKSSSSSSSSETEIFVKKVHHNKKKSSSEIEYYSNDKKTSQKSEKKHKKHSSESEKCKPKHKKHSSDSEKSEKCKPKHKKHSSESDSDSSSESEKCSFEDIYKYYKYRLVTDESLMVAGSTAYTYANSNISQIIPRNYASTFNENSLNYNIQHLYEESPFYVREDGVYIFFFVINAEQASQFSLFINGIESSLTRCGNNSGAGQLVVRNMIELKKNDAVLIRNSESTANSVEATLFIGGKQKGNDLTFLLMKISPSMSKQCVVKDWNEECLSRRNKYLFKKLTEKLLCDKELMMKGFNIHGTFWTSTAQTVLTEADVVYDNYSNVSGLLWNPTGTNPEQVKILEDGVYKLFYLANISTPAQFSFFVNGNPLDNTTQGINKGASQATLRTLVELKKNDLVTVRNHTSVNSQIVLSANAGGVYNSVSAILTIFKIAPLCKPELKECKLNKYHKVCYGKFRSYLVNQECLQVQGSPALLALSSDVHQIVPVNSNFDWNNTLIQKNIRHVNGTDSLIISQDGIYDVFIDIATNESPQLALFINNLPDASFIFGRDSGGARCLGREFVKLCKGDVLTVKNYESHIGTISTATNSGGNLVGQNCVWMLFKLSPSDDENHKSYCCGNKKKEKKEKKDEKK